MSTAAYISSTSFSVFGNVTSEFCVGRSVRCDCGTAGLFTGYITSSSYSSSTGKTTVVVSLDAGALTSQLVSVSHGNDVPASMCRATQSSVGGAILATSTEAIVGTNGAKIITPATGHQAVLSLMRDSLGKFPGVIQASLNIFCGEATSDTVPVGTFSRSTTGTRLGQTGLIETVASGNVRREWDASGRLLGWLLEKSSTNIFLYSSQFDNAAWTPSLCSVVSNSTTGPDSSVTADKLIESTDSGWHLLYYTTSVTSGNSYTVTVFAKAGGRSRFRIDGSDAGIGENNFANFDLAAITAASYGNARAKIVAVGNGFYKCSCTFTAIATTSLTFSITLINGSGVMSYTGDGASGLYLWGAQLEVSPHQTSYIPTVSTTVARSADVWTIPLGASWFSTMAGTLFVSGRTGDTPGAGVGQILAQFDDGSAANRIYIYRDSSKNIYARVVGSVTTALTLGTVADLTTFRAAFSWSSSGFSASLNGGACVTAAATALPSGLTTHRIGSDAAGGSQWGGHMLHDAYFPYALSDADKMAITL